MQSQGLKRLSEQWPLALGLAAVLALIPVGNLFSLALALFVVLRHTGILPIIGYFAVGGLVYFGFSGYSISLMLKEWGGLVFWLLPLFLMAWSLRQTRDFSFSLCVGTGFLMLAVVVLAATTDALSLDAWLGYIKCRLQFAGMSEEQFTSAFGKGDFESTVRQIMLGWPSALSLIQIGILCLARFLQAWAHYPGGFAKDFQSLRIPKLVGIVLGILILSAFWLPLETALPAMLAGLGFVLLAVAGLAYVQRQMALKQLGAGWVVAVYAVVVFASAVAIPVLAVLGLVNSILKLR